MKKWIAALMTALMLALLPATALAAPVETKLILGAYTLSAQTLAAGESGTLTLSLVNTHPTQYAQNIVVSVTSQDGALRADGTPMVYVARLNAGESTDCAFTLAAAAGAAPGNHALTVTIAYEDSHGMALTSTAQLAVETTAAVLPLRVQADGLTAAAVAPEEPVKVTVDVHNQGLSTVHNLTVTAQGDHLTVVKSKYGGNLESGASLTLEITLAFDDIVAQAAADAGNAWQTILPGDPDPTLAYPATLVLTYEDESGMQQTQQLAFDALALVPRPDEPSYTVNTDTAAGTESSPDITGWVVAGLAVIGAAAVLAVSLYKGRRRSAS